MSCSSQCFFRLGFLGKQVTSSVLLNNRLISYFFLFFMNTFICLLKNHLSELRIRQYAVQCFWLGFFETIGFVLFIFHFRFYTSMLLFYIISWELKKHTQARKTPKTRISNITYVAASWNDIIIKCNFIHISFLKKKCHIFEIICLTA